MRATASGTRAAILDAAEELFARQGFRTTTIKQIAARAGINSALLYYYFANKETLYRETLRRLVETLAERASAELGDAETPEDGVRQLVKSQAAFLLAHPLAPRLIARELIEHGGRHADGLVPVVAAGPFARLCQLVERGQREGRFRRDVDPRFAALSTVAQVAYFALARPLVSGLLGYGAGGPPREVAEAFATHAGDFAVAALRPWPPARSEGRGT
jgi:AcrR family transcriptional regulator